MGHLDPMSLMSGQRQLDLQRQAEAPSSDGIVTSQAKRKGSPCQSDGNSQGDEIEIYSGPSLPEDIWHHIHSMMQMRDAARAACVSHAFLRSWRCHPNLTFSKETLGLSENACGKDESANIFSSKVDHILTKHSGIVVKKLKIHIPLYFRTKNSSCLNKWLQIALTPGIEELTLIWFPLKGKYEFPFSLLSNGSGDSIRCLHLAGRYSFHPTVTIGCLRSLTRLHLRYIRIMEDELGGLLSHSFALEQLELRFCNRIVCLKVPCVLQRLSYLEVLGCLRLKVIENEAPNLTSFSFEAASTVQLSLGETSQMKKLYIYRCGSIFYALAKLPHSMPNLESLSIRSENEKVYTPMMQSKFIHLRHLIISFVGVHFSSSYDYLSLTSFFDAAPFLETFDLNVWLKNVGYVSIFADPSDLRKTREHHHHYLKSVKIAGFCHAKSLVELTCHILESITSLECMTLVAHQSCVTCSDPGNKFGKCSRMDRDMLIEADRAILAIRTYIEPKAPPTVKLHVLEPCRICHSIELEKLCSS